MDVVGSIALVAVLPSLHLGIGAAISSATMSLLSWFSSLETQENVYAIEASPQHGHFPRPDFLARDEPGGCINVAVAGAPGVGKSSLVNALRRLRPGDPEAAPVGAAEETTREPTAYMLQLPGWEAPPPDTPSTQAPGSPGGARGREAFNQDEEKVVETECGGVDAGSAWSGPSLPPVRLWDMPPLEWGQCWQRRASLGKQGLPHFDLVLIVYTQQLTALELCVLADLEEVFNVPHLLVRSRVDLDVESEAEDHGLCEEQVLQRLRQGACAEGAETQVFLTSARRPEEYDLPHLAQTIGLLAKAWCRSHEITECPICYEDFHVSEALDMVELGLIQPLSGEESHGHEGAGACACHWCGNAICGRCARLLRKKEGQAPCPFCRRWTTFSRIHAG